jgi:hypothetical protein
LGGFVAVILGSPELLMRLQQAIFLFYELFLFLLNGVMLLLLFAAFVLIILFPFDQDVESQSKESQGILFGKKVKK